MKTEIQRILDRNFTRGDNAKALKELCVLFNVSRSFSKNDIISFGNYIRDNYYGVGSPRLISYEPDKRPHGTIEQIYENWLVENCG